jgi:precorrin-2 dehydrogenase/sirohydrochlorin ferrochelatase
MVAEMPKKMKTEQKTFPVNLLLRGRKCLVVGAGKIAVRKIGNLMRVSAEITVISPDVSNEIRELASKGAISLVQREYLEKDVDEFFLVFAATGDKKLNARILKDCNHKKILACAIDENWKNGGFITPATIEKNGVTVSVSTNGAACRRSRMIKENLSRHLEFTNKTGMIMIGTDQNYMSLTEREPLHLVGDKFDNAGEMLSNLIGVHEFMLINTCNRIELAAFISPSESLEKLLLKILGFEAVSEDSYYVKKGFDAFSHLAFACAGLMSQTPGEKHVTSQLKSGLDYCKNKGWAGSMMQDWFDNTMHLAKHIRQIIEPLFTAFEIEDLSVKYMKDIFPDAKNRNVLLIGTGIIGQAIAEKISDLGCPLTWCYHINPPSPEKIKTKKIKICTLNEIKDHLNSADVIISVATTSAYLIHSGHAPFMNQTRKILIIDLGIPRNVCRELKKLVPNAVIADLDDLKHWHRREEIDMSRIFELSVKIVEEHRPQFEKLMDNGVRSR